MLEASAPAGKLLMTPPPVLSDETAVRIAQDFFGLDTHVRRLTAERDLNFQLTAADGRVFLLKVTNAAEPHSVTNLQTEALLHIERNDPSLPVPRLLPTREGAHEAIYRADDMPPSMIRMLTFLPGIPLQGTRRSQEQMRTLGDTLARLGLVLRDFDHPAAEHDLLWDIKNASRIRPLISKIADGDLRRIVEHFIDIFETETAAVLPALRAQVIHNDFNRHNVLVVPDRPEAICGIIDFGDIVSTPLIIDLAVAASYHIEAEGDPLQSVDHMVGAYHTVFPLRREEVDVLFDLLAARLVTTIAITNWRAERYPDNSTYILRNNRPARTGLERIANLSRAQCRSRFARICELE